MTEIVHPIRVHEYRRRPGINQSALKHMERSPAHFRHAWDNPIKPTPAMRFGSLCDHLLFGTEFAYAESEFKEFRSSDAKAYRDQMEGRGVALFQPAEIDQAELLVANLTKKQSVRDLLEGSRSQVAVFARLGQSDCKGLADAIADPWGMIVDLKITGVGAGPREFSKHIVSMSYDVQAAFYQDLVAAATGETYGFAWIVAEDEPPFESKVWVATPEVFDRGRRLYRQWLATYELCLSTQEWPGYEDKAEFINLPTWAVEA